MARLPKPGADDGTWGDILNDFLGQAHNSDGSLKQLNQSQVKDLENSLAAKLNTTDAALVATSGDYGDLTNKPVIPDASAFVADVDLDAKAAALVDDVASQTSAALQTTYLPQTGTTVLAYDSFDRYPDGQLHGKLPLVGPSYVTSGAVLPLVTNGAVYSTGTGYVYLGFDVVPTYIEEVVSWVAGDSTLSSTATMAWAKDSATGYGGADALDDLLHSTFGPSGFNLSLRNGGGSFDQLASGNWVTPCLTDGTRYRIGMAVRGNTLQIIGPNGEQFSASDARIGRLAATHTVFWEPVAAGTGRCELHEIRVLRHEPTTFGLTPNVSALDSLTRDFPAQNFESRAGTWWRTAIGQSQGGNPALMLGPNGGVGTVRTVLTSDVSIGSTTIPTASPLPSGAGTLGNGTTEGESITITGNPNPLPGGGYPYVATLTAPTTKSYPAGTTVWGSGYGQATIEYNKFDPVVKLSTDQSLQVKGNLYVGTTSDIRLVRSSAGVLGVALGAGSSAAGKGAFQIASMTTTNRPSASTVGVGAMIFDTTLNKPIWSDGTAWRDASGTIV